MKIVHFMVIVTQEDGTQEWQMNRAVLIGDEPQSLDGVVERHVPCASLRWDGTTVLAEKRRVSLMLGEHAEIDAVTVQEVNVAEEASCTLWTTVRMISDYEDGISLARWEFALSDVERLAKVETALRTHGLTAAQYSVNFDWYGSDVPRTNGDEIYVCSSGSWLQADTRHGNTRVETPWMTTFKLLDALVAGKRELFLSHKDESEKKIRDLIAQYASPVEA